eukprot:CAMPEP_0194059938 /NCGR_PEP_ID=MMETSP0009_2-20130614/70422_1 /TAXON_ID=210454 /ORGANISM="Grammatophora oceanica, Strain CCMP 410" /LENGTH=85 /DNA_ID=CAMNT_0038710687 /DNA_START=138 /DNA_END=395 /DNA_ORIENTATION=-
MACTSEQFVLTSKAFKIHMQTVDARVGDEMFQYSPHVCAAAVRVDVRIHGPVESDDLLPRNAKISCSGFKLHDSVSAKCGPIENM